MKVVAIIQARLNSTRLPRKVLAEIEGRPLIDHVVERALAIPGVDAAILNVPEADCAEIKQAVDHRLGLRFGLMAVPDQEQDVRKSYYYIARIMKADVVMRLTGDCPLLVPDLSGEVLRHFLKHQPDYCANTNPPTTWADGWDTEVFSFEAFERTMHQKDSPYARQHVTTMLKQLGACLYGPVAPHDWTSMKLSVDTDQDLKRVRAVFKELPDNPSYRMTWDATDRAARRANNYAAIY